MKEWKCFENGPRMQWLSTWATTHHHIISLSNSDNSYSVNQSPKRFFCLSACLSFSVELSKRLDFSSLLVRKILFLFQEILSFFYSFLFVYVFMRFLQFLSVDCTTPTISLLMRMDLKRIYFIPRWKNLQGFCSTFRIIITIHWSRHIYLH